MGDGRWEWKMCGLRDRRDSGREGRGGDMGFVDSVVWHGMAWHSLELLVLVVHVAEGIAWMGEGSQGWMVWYGWGSRGTVV